MKAYQKYYLWIIAAVVLLFSGFALLPLTMTAEAFAAALPWDSYASAYKSRCYVDADAFGIIHDGSSWSRAFKDLQLALADSGCVEIWVAEGTYKPTKGTDRTATFSLRTGIELYGGFNGTETLLEQRNWRTHPTILSGDIHTAQYPNDYSYHVVTAPNGYVPTPMILDGFTITGGRAERIGTGDVVGGGMVSYTSHIDLANVIFFGNYALTNGGGLYAENSDVTLLNVAFLANTAGYNGGGMVNIASDATLVDVLFYGNTAVNDGGGISFTDTIGTKAASLTNATFYANGASRGGGISADNSAVFVINTILWGNTAVSTNPQMSFLNNSLPHVGHVLVQGGCPEGVSCGDLITANPHFADASGGNFRLLPDSPAINVGIKDGNALYMIDVDLDGNPRIVGENVDLGAYEFQGRCYVKLDATGDNTGMSWTDAFTNLQSALGSSGCSEIWVAEGTYRPATNLNRSATFSLRNGVSLYGGFEGTETLVDERDWKAHRTVLTGIVGISLPPGIKAYHVVTATGITTKAILDGFTITNGNADGAIGTPNTNGGGMLIIDSDVNLNNILFDRNQAFNGGGLQISSGAVNMADVEFRGNTASQNGGGMNINGGKAWMVDSIFIDNAATENGGGMNISGVDTWMVNALFSRNTAARGGGMAVAATVGANEVILVNSTFSGNNASADGGGVYASGTAANLRNTILWGNTAVRYGPQIYSPTQIKPEVFDSLIQGGCQPEFTCNTAIITSGPLFVDAGNDDLHLRPMSPAVDAGDHAALFLLVTTDMDGNPRVIGDEVDLGPYESPQYWFVNLPLLLR